MGVWLRGGCLLGLGHLGPQALEFLVERALVREERRELLVALPEPFLERSQLFRSLLPGRRGSGQGRRIEGESRRRTSGAGVRPREPVGHVEELAQRRQRVCFRHRAVAVHRAVAERVDYPGLAEHRLACGLLEARLVNQRREVVLIRELEGWIVLVGPVHCQLERAPGVEARRARVGVSRSFGLRRRLEHGGPFAPEEGELAHTLPPRTRSISRPKNPRS